MKLFSIVVPFAAFGRGGGLWNDFNFSTSGLDHALHQRKHEGHPVDCAINRRTMDARSLGEHLNILLGCPNVVFYEYVVFHGRIFSKWKRFSKAKISKKMLQFWNNGGNDYDHEYIQ